MEAIVNKYQKLVKRIIAICVEDIFKNPHIHELPVRGKEALLHHRKCVLSQSSTQAIQLSLDHRPLQETIDTMQRVHTRNVAVHESKQSVAEVLIWEHTPDLTPHQQKTRFEGTISLSSIDCGHITL